VRVSIFLCLAKRLTFLEIASGVFDHSLTIVGMSREYPSGPLVGVGAVIVDSGRVVVIRRGRAPLLGEWSIPGGVVELGETVREAAAREALEETGLVLDVGGPRGPGSISGHPASGPGSVVGVFDRVVLDDAGRVRFHYVLVDVLCRVVSGELRAGEDAAEARWLTREELVGFPMEEAARWVLLGALDGIQRDPFRKAIPVEPYLGG
jgi:8-oxo-dGTP diphosphatase